MMGDSEKKKKQCWQWYGNWLMTKDLEEITRLKKGLKAKLDRIENEDGETFNATAGKAGRLHRSDMNCRTAK